MNIKLTSSVSAAPVAAVEFVYRDFDFLQMLTADDDDEDCCHGNAPMSGRGRSGLGEES